MTRLRKVDESHVNCNYCEEQLATQNHLFEHFDFDEDLMDIKDGHCFPSDEHEEEEEEEDLEEVDESEGLEVLEDLEEKEEGVEYVDSE